MPEGKPNDAYAFTMGFIANSKHYRSQFIDRWREILANFIVEPYGFTESSVDRPYGKARNIGYRRNRIELKDGETHKVITTYASKLVLGALGDTRAEYVQAEPVGYEDATQKAPTVSKLLRYAFTRDGVFRSLVEAVTDMLLFGTSIVEIPWTYTEREMPVRSFESIDGIEVDSFSRQRVVAYDDTEILPVDVQDFYPDPSEYVLEKMAGVAKRFRMNAMQAKAMTGNPLGFKTEAVNRAINFSPSKSDSKDSDYDQNFRKDYDQPRDRTAYPDFKEMIGFKYTGEVPWKDDIGSSRRQITILNNTVVQDIPYPLADEALPYRSMTINPVVGRFYGISPAEVIRYDQDLQDAVKILLAIAIKRQVLPPIAYDPLGDIDEAKLQAWDDDVLIPINGGPNAIGTVKYDSGVFQGFELTDRKKQDMQETSGATGGLQGQELSTKRMSATEADNTIRNAMDRPELAAALLERDSLPKIGKSILRRYQQFLPDTEALKQRVGELPEPFWIGDISGDFDVRFVGSRMAMSRQQKLQAFDRAMAYAASVPGAAALLPNLQIWQMLFGEVLELPEIAAMVGDPQQMQMNLILQQLSGQGGAAQNGVAQNQQTGGTAQVGGTTLG